MELKNRNVLVFGTGISGIAASNLLQSCGAEVILYDGNEAEDKEKILAQLNDKQTRIILGNLGDEIISGLDLAVLSPGVPTDIPDVNRMREQGIPIWGEIELGFSCERGNVLAVTGTNGKTTTTALLGEIMKHVGEQVHVVGNIGIPYTSVVQETTPDSVTIAEISSFQLETIHDFCPAVSAILNITPDHLNRHHTMEAYIQAKMNISKNQGQKQTCVLNYEDEVLREFGASLQTNVLYFSSLRKLEKGLYLDGEQICYADGQQIYPLIDTKELNILGRHNYENVMAAAGMALKFGVPLEKIQETLRTFQAVEHRIEYVTEKSGVRFYNDSKGTNPDAAIKGIQAMNRPTCLIGGGYDKQSEYEEWIQAFEGKVKKLVLIGQTREKIAETAERLGFHDWVYADSLQEAVDICYACAAEGDAVLLSPACASWGMFPNYEVRGRMFKEMAHALPEK